jgi:hypothetical protein
MKTAVISSIQFGKYDRMDAAFHLAVQSVAAEVAALEAQGKPDELVAKLAAVSTADLGPVLAPLMTGSRQVHYARRELDVAIARYPYVAYALVARAQESIRERARLRIADEQAYLDGLAGLTPVVPPPSGSEDPQA